MWRKNRRPAECHNKEWHTVCCRGVDLNRNFDWYWAGTVATVSPRLPYSIVVVIVKYPCSPAASVSFSLWFLLWFVSRYIPWSGCILWAWIGCCQGLPRGVSTEGKRSMTLSITQTFLISKAIRCLGLHLPSFVLSNVVDSLRSSQKKLPKWLQLRSG